MTDNVRWYTLASAVEHKYIKKISDLVTELLKRDIDFNIEKLNNERVNIVALLTTEEINTISQSGCIVRLLYPSLHEGL